MKKGRLNSIPVFEVLEVVGLRHFFKCWNIAWQPDTSDTLISCKVSSLRHDRATDLAKQGAIGDFQVRDLQKGLYKILYVRGTDNKETM